MNLKNKINLSIFIFLILSIFLVLFLISPLLKDIKAGSAEILVQKENLVTLEAKAESFERFKKSLQEIKPNLEKIDKLFISSEAPVDFIDFLEKTSKESSLEIKISSALSTKVEKDLWPSLVFQITSVGSFPAFLKFLEKLELEVYLIEIQNLNVTRIGEAELKTKEYEKLSSGGVKANLSIKVYAK